MATRHRRGGAEKNVAFTIEWEREQGHEVHFVVGRDSFEEELPAAASKTWVEPDLVRELSPMHDIRAYRTLRRQIRDGAYDVVHTHQSKAGVVGRLAARGLAPVVLHTIHMASFGPAYNKVASLGFVMAERYCARTTTRIVSVGAELAAMYQGAGIGSVDQYRVIRSPIDLDSYLAVRGMSPAERSATRDAIGFSAPGHRLVIAASLEPRKRVDLAIRELSPILRQGLAHLVIAGDGPERPAIEALARDLGVADGIKLLGQVQDVSELMAAADLLVHTATVEGVPQVVIQSLASGVPVVATEMVGLGEVSGAPIVATDASGRDLLAAVRRTLAAPPDPVPADRLAAWSKSAIRERLDELSAEIRPLVARR